MSERSSSKGHQSVYDKALAIFQERIKKLKVVEQEIEKERVQTNIDYKFEERKIKEDLINMCRDSVLLRKQNLENFHHWTKRKSTKDGQ